VPKIEWSGLPEALRTHLLLFLKEPRVTAQDLLNLMEWRQSEVERELRLVSTVNAG
jgi:hypothetical protein